jgi:GNAT superfamily N-acetyltransferase
MAANPVIRPVAPDEYARVGDLTVAAYAGLPGFVDVGGYARELRDVAGRVRDAEVFVACVDDKIVGGITFVADSTSPLSEWDDAGASGIRMLAIAPEAQGMGLGRALTEFTLERSRTLGKKRMLLHSASFMAPAHKLYESMGFVRLPEIDFEVDPVILLGYRLELASH